MPKTVSAEFDTRRDAEMAIEHIVQEYGIDAGTVQMTTVEASNTAGTRVAGGDLENGRPKTETEGEPALAGRLRLAIEVDDAQFDAVQNALSDYKAR